jgi:ribosomal-protein-alanine N-acetyltransferase
MKSKGPQKRAKETRAGARVFVRAPGPGDEAEFLALMRASVRMHRGLVSPPTQSKGFAKFLQHSDRPDSVWLLVCRREDGRIVGAFHLSQIFYGNLRSAYMGYYAGEPYAGRGYMTEAMRLVLRRAFVQLKLHRVEANIQPDNAASIALVRRAGFTHEGFSRRYLKVGGRWRDHERWAILREDWRAARGGRD